MVVEHVESKVCCPLLGVGVAVRRRAFGAVGIQNCRDLAAFVQSEEILQTSRTANFCAIAGELATITENTETESLSTHWKTGLKGTGERQIRVGCGSCQRQSS